MTVLLNMLRELLPGMLLTMLLGLLTALFPRRERDCSKHRLFWPLPQGTFVQTAAATDALTQNFADTIEGTVTVSTASNLHASLIYGSNGSNL